jgi:hypothetical protein
MSKGVKNLRMQGFRNWGIEEETNSGIGEFRD